MATTKDEDEWRELLRDEDEWKELVVNDEIAGVDIVTIQQWVKHPKIDRFIDWKDENIALGRTMLLSAITYNRFDIFKLLLEHGANVEIGNMYGLSAIILASYYGRTNFVERLCQKGANLNITENGGRTALIWASGRGHTDTVQFLLDKDADVSIADARGDSAFDAARDAGHTEIAELLLAKIKEKWKALVFDHDEIAGVDIVTIQQWVKHPKIDRFIDWKDENIVLGRTMLLSAIKYNRFDIFKLLLEHGANVEIGNKYGLSAMILASFYGRTNFVERLCQKGANLNITENGGRTALIWASTKGHSKTVQFLLDKGADFNIADNDGDSAFNAARDAGHTEIAELLLAKIREKWKELISKDEIETVDIETIQQWMKHPQIGAVVNWKDDSIENGKTMLSCAICYKRLDIANILLQRGTGLNITDGDGWTPSMYAADAGYTEVLKLLLDKGADPSIADNYGQTALGLASLRGQNESVELLLDAGGNENINAASVNGWTALMGASYTGHNAIVKSLLDNGADATKVNEDGDNAYTLASDAGHTEIVELLADWKEMEEWRKLADGDALIDVDIETFKRWVELPKQRFGINWKDDSVENGKTLLSCAICYETLDIANILLKAGADVTIGDALGSTPLMYASQGGHKKILKSMIDKGANLNVVDKNGKNALMHASEKGRTKIVEHLLNKGADLNVVDKNGDSALIEAVFEGHIHAVELLLDRGADILVVNKFGDSVFTLASDRGNVDILHLLLNKLSDLNILEAGDQYAAALDTCNGNGQTLLHLACLHSKKKAAQQVLQCGIDKDKIDKNGHSALFYAAERGLVEIVDLLLNQNADGNKTDERKLIQGTDRRGRTYSFYNVEDGRTPLFIAAQNGHQNVVALLLHHRADPYLCNKENRIPRHVSVVYGPIQQLFRIQHFFDQREQCHKYNPKYITCDKLLHQELKEKGPVPPLRDIIHDIVKYPHFAGKFLELYQENREIVNWIDNDGRTVRQVACKECREAILFLGQYDLDAQPMYESPTCKIYIGLDYGGHDEPNLTQPRRVAMKFMEKKEHFLNEMQTRRNDDGSARFSSEFVTPDLAAYSADNDPEYVMACRIWKRDGAELDQLPGHCIVMPLGERSLLEAMNAENLSAPHKDLQRREILLTLCKIFSYLHGMGYVHGDVKPQNVVRHTDPTATWKAIDFDACTKIGEVVGLKLTTGSAPPEMLKIIQSNDSTNTESMGESKVILRQSEGDLEESDLVLADPSFDVWSYGILMYQLVTGMSFFHCDLQGNVDDSGLQELANLTEGRIHEKLGGVKDVNARVLLAKILRLNPRERPTMSEIGRDYYFHPSEAPQGRKAQFLGKQLFSTSVLMLLESETEEKTSLAPGASLISSLEEAYDDGTKSAEEIKKFVSSKAEFSYFKLRDEDKDWNDKLLNSEVETFHFDKLGGMGEKPRLIDADIIYGNDFLRNLLSSKGPDYFMGVLVEYFKLYEIMNDAIEVCQGIKANLVSDVKDLKGIFIKLFVRGKGLNDVVRGTLFCNSIDQFKYVGIQLKERYGHKVFIKPPKKEAGAWPIPKLLIYGSRHFHGRCMSVEIQFSTVYMHLATHASNNHLVYEAIRESTGYLGHKDKDFQKFLEALNEQYIDTEGFLGNQRALEGRFEIVVDHQPDDNGDGNGNDINAQTGYTTKGTGFASGGRIRCGDKLFRFLSPTDRFQRFSESSFVVNKSLTLLSSHSYWSDESYYLEEKVVEFVVSFKGRGLVIAGLGSTKCLHGSLEGNGGGARCSVHIGRSKFVVRRNGLEEVFREQKLPNQERAKIRFKMKDGLLSVSFVGSERFDDEKELESAQVNIPRDQRYYLYMRAPPGVHDVKFHDVGIVHD